MSKFLFIPFMVIAAFIGHNRLTDLIEPILFPANSLISIRLLTGRLIARSHSAGWQGEVSLPNTNKQLISIPVITVLPDLNMKVEVTGMVTELRLVIWPFFVTSS